MLGWEVRKQIPFGDDRQKSKGKSNDNRRAKARAVSGGG